MSSWITTNLFASGSATFEKKIYIYIYVHIKNKRKDGQHENSVTCTGFSGGGGVNPLTLYMQKDKPRGGGKALEQQCPSEKESTIAFWQNWRFKSLKGDKRMWTGSSKKICARFPGMGFVGWGNLSSDFLNIPFCYFLSPSPHPPSGLDW